MNKSFILAIVFGLATCAPAPDPRAPAPCPALPAIARGPTSATAVASTPSPMDTSTLPTAASAQPDPPSPGSLVAMEGFPELSVFPEMGVSAACGGFLVEPVTEGMRGLGLRLKNRDGTLAAQLVPQMGIDSYMPTVCGDLTGDGVADLLVAYSTGGAHCCHTDIVLSLEAKPRVLLSIDMGDGGQASPVKLTAGKAFQLELRDMSLYNVIPGPYATVPSLPMILQWDGKSWVDRTRKFPDLVRKRRAQWMKDQGCQPGDTECEQYMGMLVGALSHLVGDWPAQRGKLPAGARTAGDKIVQSLAAQGR